MVKVNQSPPPDQKLLEPQVKEAPAKPENPFLATSKAAQAKGVEIIVEELGEKSKKLGHICNGDDGCDKTKEAKKEKINPFATITKESQKKAADQIKKAVAQSQELKETVGHVHDGNCHQNDKKKTAEKANPFLASTTEAKEKAKAQMQANSSSGSKKDFGHICTGSCNLHNRSKLFDSKPLSNNYKGTVDSRPKQTVSAAKNNTAPIAENKTQTARVSNNLSSIHQNNNSNTTATRNLSQGRSTSSLSIANSKVNIQSPPNGNKQSSANFAQQTAVRVAKNVSSQSHGSQNSKSVPFINNRASNLRGGFSKSSMMKLSSGFSNTRSVFSNNIKGENLGNKTQARNSAGANGNSKGLFSQSAKSQSRVSINIQTSKVNAKQASSGALSQQKIVQGKVHQSLSHQKTSTHKGSTVGALSAQPNIKQALKGLRSHQSSQTFNQTLGNQKGISSKNSFNKLNQALGVNQKNIVPNSNNSQKSIVHSKKPNQTLTQKLAKVNSQLSEVRNILSYMGLVSFRQQIMNQDPSLASSLANAIASMMAGKMILKEEKNKLLEKFKKLQAIKKKLSRELNIPFEGDQEGFLIDWELEAVA